MDFLLGIFVSLIALAIFLAGLGIGLSFAGRK